jgi:hypothetical protein
MVVVRQDAEIRHIGRATVLLVVHAGCPEGPTQGGAHLIIVCRSAVEMGVLAVTGDPDDLRASADEATPHWQQQQQQGQQPCEHPPYGPS